MLLATACSLVVSRTYGALNSEGDELPPLAVGGVSEAAATKGGCYTADLIMPVRPRTWVHT
jgi:hypothetical protein